MSIQQCTKILLLKNYFDVVDTIKISYIFLPISYHQ